MPHYIVKPKADENFYVDWSTITDCPAAWGTRDFLQNYYVGRGEEAHADQERFDRADKTGSSSRIGDYGYDDTEFWIANVAEEDFIVDRYNLRAFCESWDGKTEGVYDKSLTRPVPTED